LHRNLLLELEVGTAVEQGARETDLEGTDRTEMRGLKILKLGRQPHLVRTDPEVLV
jgi:hypothetical protein